MFFVTIVYIVTFEPKGMDHCKKFGKATHDVQSVLNLFSQSWLVGTAPVFESLGRGLDFRPEQIFLTTHSFQK